jgi:hypothetical protein
MRFVATITGTDFNCFPYTDVVEVERDTQEQAEFVFRSTLLDGERIARVDPVTGAGHESLGSI